MDLSSSSPNNKHETLDLHSQYFDFQLRFYAHSNFEKAVYNMIDIEVQKRYIQLDLDIKEKKIEVLRVVSSKSNEFVISHLNEDIASDNLMSNLYSLLDQAIKEENEAHVD
ncbi:hypothetical protein L2E82_32221 [Cichorium intybus]|uniref:Uncharacterized protein n=1 Tax=Cichorium intybus TaxID=13427 RepID=A0ACB9BGX5_CICIN|nr:hypothetical protein L2E82_32221 [Cichorium intybus]